MLIDKALYHDVLTKRQRELMNYWMCGYKEKDIADKFNTSQQNVHKTLKQSCEKIRKYIEKEINN